MKPISLSGVGVRFSIALALVLATWNPLDINYVDLARQHWAEQAALVFFFGIVLTICWVVFLRATLRSLGPVGITLAVAMAAAILWLLLDFNLIELSNRTAMEWILLVLLSAILGAGMSWSHLRRRWAGQADVDDLDEEG